MSDKIPNETNSVCGIDPTAIGNTFTIKDYLEATADASTRTRYITIVLVIASVLIFLGFWNSFKSSWATERVRSAYDSQYNKYKMLAEGKHLDENIDKAAYEKNLQEQVVRAYVDNVRFIKLPFFGIAVEVNDLGTIGGVALIIILLLLRFSISREIKNLNVSFKEAVHHNQLCEFYHALAMRQVLTIPEMTGEERNLLLSSSSKIVYILPVFVILLGVIYDFYSSLWLKLFPFEDVLNTHLFESIFFATIIWLSIRCYERQRHIDEIWECYWNEINKEQDKSNSSIVRIDKKTVAKFKNKEAIIDVLKELLKQENSQERPVETNQNDKPLLIKLNEILKEDSPPNGILIKKFGSDKIINDKLVKQKKTNKTISKTENE